jgi:hypothetical protein
MNDSQNLPLNVSRCTGYKPRGDLTCPDRLICERYLQIGRDRMNGVEGESQLHVMEFPYEDERCLFIIDANKKRKTP